MSTICALSTRNCFDVLIGSTTRNIPLLIFIRSGRNNLFRRGLTPVLIMSERDNVYPCRPQFFYIRWDLPVWMLHRLINVVKAGILSSCELPFIALTLLCDKTYYYMVVKVTFAEEKWWYFSYCWSIWILDARWSRFSEAVPAGTGVCVLGRGRENLYPCMLHFSLYRMGFAGVFMYTLLV